MPSAITPRTAPAKPAAASRTFMRHLDEGPLDPMARLTRPRHKRGRLARSPGTAVDLEIHMQDLLLLGLGAASFALLALYLMACERG